MKINELIIRFKARLKTKYINLSKKDYAFLHIPKTGGTYIMQLEKFNSPVIRPINYYDEVKIFPVINFQIVP